MSKARASEAKNIAEQAGYRTTKIKGILNRGEFLIEIENPQRHQVEEYQKKFRESQDYVGNFPHSVISVTSDRILDASQDGGVFVRMHQENLRIAALLRENGHKSQAYETETDDKETIPAARTF